MQEEQSTELSRVFEVKQLLHLKEARGSRFELENGEDAVMMYSV